MLGGALSREALLEGAVPYIGGQLLLRSGCRPSAGFKPSGGRRGPQIQHLLMHAESLCAAGWSPPGGRGQSGPVGDKDPRARSGPVGASRG
jgi:hypothetical protein